MLFYITFNDFNSFFASGIEKKIKGQIEAMEPEFGEIYYTGWSYPMAYLMSKEGIVEKDIAVTRKNYTEVLIDWFQKYGVTKTYIRYSAAGNKWFIDLLEYQKNHQIKTVLEIATYPYDKAKAEGISKMEDMGYREEISGYVDRIATYSYDKEIWGIPCIGLVNGISLRNIPISTRKKEKNRLVLIAVSSMQFWHGYERILKGIWLYYKEGGEYDLKFKLIGSGSEEQRYKDLVKQYNLEPYVEFVGRIEPGENEKLDEEYNQSDIAISGLGAYKVDITEASPIKGAEYCAKGLPFVCGYSDMRFPKDWEFIMNVSNDPEPIDINKVISFYESITLKKDYKKLMRDYAISHLSWDGIMKPVIEYLKE